LSAANCKANADGGALGFGAGGARSGLAFGFADACGFRSAEACGLRCSGGRGLGKPTQRQCVSTTGAASFGAVCSGAAASARVMRCLRCWSS